MIYRFNELGALEKYNSRRKIEKAIENGNLHKISYNLYSESLVFSDLEFISKCYPNTIFTSDSAFFYHGLTDNIPKKYYLATKKHAKKIKDEKIIQTFVEDKFWDVGNSTIIYNNIKIRIYDKERMLIELVRNKNQMAYDMYKEIVNNYRQIVEELNLLKLQRYLTFFSNGNNILKVIQEEIL